MESRPRLARAWRPRRSPAILRTLMGVRMVRSAPEPFIRFIAFVLLSAATACWSGQRAQADVFDTLPTWYAGRADDAESVAFGDVNGDGDLDLVCGNQTTGATLYLNRGNTLASAPVWSSEPADYMTSVALGDVDGDGDLDLVCGSLYSGTTLYLNQGDTFATSPAWSSVSVGLTRSVALGDIDRDGDLDLVCGNNGLSTNLYLNQGGTFDTTPVWSSPPNETYSVALGDLDGDGDLDLVCGNHTQRTDIYLNEGGVLATDSAVHFGSADCVALGDVDGDGDLDLVGGGYGLSTTLSLNQSGTFTATPTWSSGSAQAARSVALGDVDGDGDLDLACGNDGQSTTLYLNQGGTFAAAPAWSSGPADRTTCVAFGDANGDGQLDLVCGNQGIFPIGSDKGPRDPGTLRAQSALPARTEHGSSTTLYLNRGGVFATAPVASSGPGDNTTSVTLGDVDGDGDLDLVCANHDQSTKLYLNNSGVLAATPAWSSETADQTTCVALGDVDGDGDLDLVCGNYLQSSTLYLNQGGTFATNPAWSSWSLENTNSVAFGDVDGDGDLDLVCGNAGHGTTLYINEGGTLGTVPAWTLRGENPTSSVALGDVDGDGDLDLVCGGQGASLYLNGGGVFATNPASSSGLADYTTTVALGDVDGDGDLDLVCGSPGQSTTLYLNQGGSFATNPAWSSGPADRTNSVALGDVDGDGDLDLVCGNTRQSTTLYLNQGGMFAINPAWSSGPADETNGVALGDVDGDGDLDLVCGNFGQSTTVYTGLGLPPFTGNPLTPTNQLPNTSAFLRNVRVDHPDQNSLRFHFTSTDVESDPVWIAADFQYEGDPRWVPIQFDAPSPVGPFPASPAGTNSFPAGGAYSLNWDITHLPIDHRKAIVRLKAISPPHRAGVIQNVANYRLPVGQVLPIRPQVTVATSSLDFDDVTVGDTTQMILPLINTGSDTLVVDRVGLPSVEMVLGAPLPLVLRPGELKPVSVFVRPVWETAIDGSITLYSNDPINPDVSVPISTHILPLAVTTRLIEPPGGIRLGEALTVIVIPLNGARVEEGTLHVLVPGQESQSFSLVPAGTSLSSIIPGNLVTELGLRYYVELMNRPAAATDPMTAPDSTYAVSVPAPSLVTSAAQPNSGAAYLAGRDVRVLVSLQQGTVFQEGTLYYRQSGASEYSQAPVAREAGTLSAVIPGTAAGLTGLEYWVVVKTANNTTLQDDAQTIRVTVPGVEETSSSPARVYRMVSLPLDFGPDFTGTLATLLGGESAFGSYDPLRWRCFRYAPDLETYLELSDPSEPETFNVHPGRAYWLTASQENRMRVSVPGTSTSAAGAFSLTLAPGWNQIGNPFAFPVRWDSVRVSPDPLAVEPPRRWDSGASRYDASDVTVLEPFDGYFVWNAGPGDAVLTIPPVGAGAASPAMLASTASAARDATARRASLADAAGWRAHVSASTPGASDGGKLFGTATGALPGRDRWDRTAPPASPGPTLSVYFLGSDASAGNSARRLSADIRPLPAAGSETEGESWSFDVLKSFSREGSADEVTLRFSGLDDVPQGLSVRLIDRRLEQAVDLRSAPEYRFFLAERAPVASADQARFELRVGSEAFVRSGPIAARPQNMRLLQNYPNPVRSGTVIRYELADHGKVTVRIFDISGRLVKTMRVTHDAPGRYEMAWRGEDDQGRRVAAGLYTYRLEQGTHAESRKMLVVK